MKKLIVAGIAVLSLLALVIYCNTQYMKRPEMEEAYKFQDSIRLHLHPAAR